MARLVGERPGKSQSSRHTNSQQGITFSSRTLHSDECILLNRNTAANNIDNREKHTVVIKGIKFCVKVRNFETYPLWVNVAVIHPKTELGVGNDIPNDEFFRSFGTTRSQDFDVNTMTPMDFHCFPINTDKYVVLRHKRFTLGPAGAFTTGANWQPTKLLDFYVKLNRQIRYAGDSATDLEEGQVYLAYWCDSPDSASNSPAVASSMQVDRRFITYFKNPR